MTDYIRRCPVCATEAPPEEVQCGHCGTLLQGVDLSLKNPAVIPAPTPAAIQAPVAEERICPHADCAMPNPPGGEPCLYCGRPLTNITHGAVLPAPTFLRLPVALASKFRIVEVLPASGAEAEILRLEGLSSGVKVIAKLYRPGLMPKTEVLERVSRVAFRHVVHLIAWGESEGVGYEVMEYCSGGSLRQWMAQAAPLRRDQLRDILVEIAEALAALHELHVIHRDLKPENILVRRAEPLDLVLTDFGIASVADATQLFTSTARTVKYGAPETLAGVLDNAADWWSLGLVLVELLTGQHPFEGLSDAVITHHLVTGTLDCREVDDPEWRKLCCGLLLRNPQQRWGMAEIRRWLSGDDSLVAPTADNPATTPHAARPYRLEGSRCATPLELALALATHWEAGRKDLMRGQLSAWIGQELRDDDLLRFVQDQIDRRDSSDDMRLLRVIRHLAPELPPVWRSHSLMSAALAAQSVRAEKQDAQAAEWLVSVFNQKVLRELPAARFPVEAALAARWEAAYARVDTLWRETEAQHLRKQPQQYAPGVADFDALVFGQTQDMALPPPAQVHPPLLLALADEPFAQALHAQTSAELAPHVAETPWLATLLAADDPAGWIVARRLLPHARKAAVVAQQHLQQHLAAQAAERAALVSRTNQALAALRDGCQLGWLADHFQRNTTAAASQSLLALIEEARAEGLPADTPLMRTLQRAEPLVLRIQARLDEWEHAAHIHAVWRNRNFAQGIGGFLFFAFLLADELMPRNLFIWLLIGFALVVGWRLWGIAKIRGAIRSLAKSLPLRVPAGAIPP